MSAELYYIIKLIGPLSLVNLTLDVDLQILEWYVWMAKAHIISRFVIKDEADQSIESRIFVIFVELHKTSEKNSAIPANVPQ